MIEKTKRILQWIPIAKNNGKKYVGLHLVAEFWHPKFIQKIENKKTLKEILFKTVKEANATPLKCLVYKFSPQGITGIILLAESHIAIHSWPEINYVAIDVFTCGEKSFPHKAIDYLKKILEPQGIEIREIKRGVI
jgi:S-adenosylmethionine decarboxylase